MYYSDPHNYKFQPLHPSPSLSLHLYLSLSPSFPLIAMHSLSKRLNIARPQVSNTAQFYTPSPPALTPNTPRSSTNTSHNGKSNFTLYTSFLSLFLHHQPHHHPPLLTFSPAPHHTFLIVICFVCFD